MLDQARLRTLEPLCARAPSAHNTQPWRLSYRADRVEVGWDPADTLPAGDPTGRDLRLSLGAYVETWLVVAAAAGLGLAFTPDHCAAAHRVGWLRPAAERYRTPFDAGTVRDRATHRGGYLTGPEPGTLAAADAIARSAGGALRPVPDTALAGLLPAADRHLYADPATVRELRGWLRLTPNHPRYERDGLTDRCLHLSRAQAAGLRAALAGYPVLRRLGLPRLLAAAGGGPVRPGGRVLALAGPPALDEPGQVEFGRVLMQVWLTFTAAGLACRPLSQLLDAPATRAALASQLRVAPEQLLHVARVGLPATAPVPSHRRVLPPPVPA
ncbi:MAG: nitroreductase [Micromonosporaceae bacterium]|nr:nitroreductase [Micromonosporaceae bacterium]